MEEKNKIEQVAASAEAILKEFPAGIRFSALIRKIRETYPALKGYKGIGPYVQWLPRRYPNKFFKPSRGVFQLVDQQATNLPHASVEQAVASEIDSTSKLWNEASFYQPFADYLTNDLDECGKAIVVGGNRFGGKWGTPDVIGVTVPEIHDIYKPPIEIISVEVKTNTNELVVAFGQACSYLLFSHKSYIVVPAAANPSDIDRLENLCQVFGIGLVLIGSLDPNDPAFELRVRALRREPEPFYVNRNLRVVSEELFAS